MRHKIKKNEDWISQLHKTFSMLPEIFHASDRHYRERGRAVVPNVGKNFNHLLEEDRYKQCILIYGHSLSILYWLELCASGVIEICHKHSSYHNMRTHNISA